jgi:hypothetical protein
MKPRPRAISAPIKLPKIGRDANGAVGLVTFSALVNDYIRRHRPRIQVALGRYRAVSLREAIELASRGEIADGWRSTRQRGVPQRLVGYIAERLLAHEAEFGRCGDFETLHALVKHAIGHLKGVGALGIYDMALRIGSNVGLEPETVYLHAGSRKGALVLGFEGETLGSAALPRPFRKLRPCETEDLLSNYRSELLKIMRARSRSR